MKGDDSDMEDYTPKEGKAHYTAKQKLENFWYHYKWHSIICLFVLIAVIICSLQFCSKSSYDSHLMYAGPYDATRGEVLDMQSSLNSICGDLDGDGKTDISVTSLFLVTDSQAEEINSRGEGYKVNGQVVSDNSKIFDQNVQTGEIVVFLLDPSRFNMLYSDKADECFLLPIKDYLPSAGSDGFEYVNDFGIYLKSTGAATLPGLCNLPDDTILCIRAKGSLTSMFKKKTAEKNHASGEALMRAILSYSVPENK